MSTERVVEIERAAYTRRPVTTTLAVDRGVLATVRMVRGRASRADANRRLTGPRPAPGSTRSSTPRRERQDPCGLPVVPVDLPGARPEPATGPRHARPRPRPLCLPAQALTYDVERVLRAPLTGIGLAAQRLGEEPPRITVASRTGDTPTDDRREPARSPAGHPHHDSQKACTCCWTSQAREILRGVEHAHRRGPRHRRKQAWRASRPEPGTPGAPARRRRACAPAHRPERDPATAWQAIARFLGGIGSDREVAIVDAGTRKPLELRVVVPVEDMSRLGEVLPARRAAWRPGHQPDLRSRIRPSIHPAILELIRQHHSTIVFTNPRGASASASPTGSTSWRARSSSAPTTAASPASNACTSRRSPPRPHPGAHRDQSGAGHRHGRWSTWSSRSNRRRAYARAAAGRPGRAPGRRTEQHHLPEVPRRPAQCAVVTRHARGRDVEHTTIPRNPLDVLAQQLVAMTVSIADRRRTARDGDPRGTVRVADARGPRRRPGHARGRPTCRRKPAAPKPRVV